MLTIGKPAPDFELPDQFGNKHKLSDYRGKSIVIYFYPKDNTPGCTKEACSFRDSFADYRKAGVEVLGISVDDEKSHEKFIDKYNLPFTLLSDKDKEVVEKYGVWVEKNMYGRKYFGTARKTFLLDKEGVLKYVFGKVKPEHHATDVLEKLSE
ncbi:MAG: thioredoxin-dependent thiol peroxidase [candidate division Zixibacteria bacterium]|nr:thioredoxin-dependent thiol peroxidase [candidate division Zixibacteria bacterium]